MNRAIGRYGLVGAGWLLMLAALPLAGAALNGFLGWHGPLDTRHFLAWLLAEPQRLAAEGVEGVAWWEVLWLVAVLLGLLMFVAAPVLVNRVRTPRSHGLLVRLALVLWVLPLTTVAPAGWGLPVADTGMWLAAAGQVLVFAGLALRPKAQNTAMSAG